MLASMTALVTTFALAATAPAPKWESDYGKALAQTRADERPLLIVLDNPGAEKEQLAPEVLGQTDKELLAAYDLCRVDVTTEYGKKVADAFKAKTFPYVAIIDKSGSVILHRHAGSLTTESWTTTLTTYQKGERAVRHTVAKPVTSEATPVHYSAPRSDCPNCRRGY